MKAFIGTKLVLAQPMSRGAYNTYQGWTIPVDQNPDDEGYLVEYVDGGESNHKLHVGYISWSPKAVFERAYRPSVGLDFGAAVLALKAGQKVAREGWNGRGMFVFLVPGSVFKVNRPPLLGIYPEGTEITYRPHINIKNVDGTIATWVPSITDLMAEDWQVVA